MEHRGSLVIVGSEEGTGIRVNILAHTAFKRLVPTRGREHLRAAGLGKKKKHCFLEVFLVFLSLLSLAAESDERCRTDDGKVSDVLE